MRLANLGGRLVLLTGTDGTAGVDGTVDVAAASRGRFGPDPQTVYDAWPEFVDWAAGAGAAVTGASVPLDRDALGPVVPRPRQVFAVGLNYVDHTAESGLQQPTQPMIFTKFQSCLTGPYGEITLPSESVDWEIELVAVVGETTVAASPEAAWRRLAGVTIGQDLSDRAVQMLGVPPQFSLGKSFAGFGPVGPWLTTVDELPDRDKLTLTCAVNGEVVQQASTSDLVFPVPELVSYLSGICALHPGDLIFTGTPPGVGMGRRPPRYLAPGDVLESRIDGLGEMRHRLVAPASATPSPL